MNIQIGSNASVTLDEWYACGNDLIAFDHPNLFSSKCHINALNSLS